MLTSTTVYDTDEVYDGVRIHLVCNHREDHIELVCKNSKWTTDVYVDAFNCTDYVTVPPPPPHRPGSCVPWGIIKHKCMDASSSCIDGKVHAIIPQAVNASSGDSIEVRCAKQPPFKLLCNDSKWMTNVSTDEFNCPSIVTYSPPAQIVTYEHFNKFLVSPTPTHCLKVSHADPVVLEAVKGAHVFTTYAKGLFEGEDGGAILNCATDHDGNWDLPLYCKGNDTHSWWFVPNATHDVVAACGCEVMPHYAIPYLDLNGKEISTSIYREATKSVEIVPIHRTLSYKCQGNAVDSVSVICTENNIMHTKRAPPVGFTYCPNDNCSVSKAESMWPNINWTYATNGNDDGGGIRVNTSVDLQCKSGFFTRRNEIPVASCAPGPTMRVTVGCDTCLNAIQNDKGHTVISMMTIGVNTPQQHTVVIARCNSGWRSRNDPLVPAKFVCHNSNGTISAYNECHRYCTRSGSEYPIVVAPDYPTLVDFTIKSRITCPENYATSAEFREACVERHFVVSNQTLVVENFNVYKRDLNAYVDYKDKYNDLTEPCARTCAIPPGSIPLSVMAYTPVGKGLMVLGPTGVDTEGKTVAFACKHHVIEATCTHAGQLTVPDQEDPVKFCGDVAPFQGGGSSSSDEEDDDIASFDSLDRTLRTEIIYTHTYGTTWIRRPTFGDTMKILKVEDNGFKPMEYLLDYYEDERNVRHRIDVHVGEAMISGIRLQYHILLDNDLEVAWRWDSATMPPSSTAAAGNVMQRKNCTEFPPKYASGGRILMNAHTIPPPPYKHNSHVWYGCRADREEGYMAKGICSNGVWTIIGTDQNSEYWCTARNKCRPLGISSTVTNMYEEEEVRQTCVMSNVPDVTQRPIALHDPISGGSRHVSRECVTSGGGVWVWTDRDLRCSPMCIADNTLVPVGISVCGSRCVSKPGTLTGGMWKRDIKAPAHIQSDEPNSTCIRNPCLAAEYMKNEYMYDVVHGTLRISCPKSGQTPSTNKHPLRCEPYHSPYVFPRCETSLCISPDAWAATGIRSAPEPKMYKDRMVRGEWVVQDSVGSTYYDTVSYGTRMYYKCPVGMEPYLSTGNRAHNFAYAIIQCMDNGRWFGISRNGRISRRQLTDSMIPIGCMPKASGACNVDTKYFIEQMLLRGDVRLKDTDVTAMTLEVADTIAQTVSALGDMASVEFECMPGFRLNVTNNILWCYNGTLQPSLPLRCEVVPSTTSTTIATPVVPIINRFLNPGVTTAPTAAVASSTTTTTEGASSATAASSTVAPVTTTVKPVEKSIWDTLKITEWSSLGQIIVFGLCVLTLIGSVIAVVVWRYKAKKEKRQRMGVSPHPRVMYVRRQRYQQAPQSEPQPTAAYQRYLNTRQAATQTTPTASVAAAPATATTPLQQQSGGEQTHPLIPQTHQLIPTKQPQQQQQSAVAV